MIYQWYAYYTKSALAPICDLSHINHNETGNELCFQSGFGQDKMKNSCILLRAR